MPKSLTPQPKSYPVCSTCDVAYVLRLCIVFKSTPRHHLVAGQEWVYQRDCKHRSEAKLNSPIKFKGKKQ